jgi:hypothetical protein
MRPENPTAHQDIWLTRFLRVVLTARPALRRSLDYQSINRLYETRPDPIQAAREYLGG